jgi:5-methylthioribose kinase
MSYYEEKLDELKEKLDKKEYVVQYKEHIWATFERELKKVVKKDSELYRKL